MPIYEYVCPGCKLDFEVLIRGQEQPVCPKCGGKRLTKKFSVPAAHTGAATPACPMKEAGSCAMPGCGGGACGGW